jgi:hypothetical protein
VPTWGGNFVTVEGPRFSTKAESRVFRSWGMDIIGMTTTPEAQLAREAEMSYAVMAHVTDYDVWHESETPVTVEMVIQTLLAQHRRRQTGGGKRHPPAGRRARLAACLRHARRADQRLRPIKYRGAAQPVAR